jgi:hypothetical protein
VDRVPRADTALGRRSSGLAFAAVVTGVIATPVATFEAAGISMANSELGSPRLKQSHDQTTVVRQRFWHDTKSRVNRLARYWSLTHVVKRCVMGLTCAAFLGLDGDAASDEKVRHGMRIWTT